MSRVPGIMCHDPGMECVIQVRCAVTRDTMFQEAGMMCRLTQELMCYDSQVWCAVTKRMMCIVYPGRRLCSDPGSIKGRRCWNDPEPLAKYRCAVTSRYDVP